MEDKEFIAQMAQFSSLEQAQNTSRITKLNSAYNMVNKLISATVKDENNDLKDVVGIEMCIRDRYNSAWCSKGYCPCRCQW